MCDISKKPHAATEWCDDLDAWILYCMKYRTCRFLWTFYCQVPWFTCFPLKLHCCAVFFKFSSVPNFDLKKNIPYFQRTYRSIMATRDAKGASRHSVVPAFASNKTRSPAPSSDCRDGHTLGPWLSHALKIPNTMGIHKS